MGELIGPFNALQWQQLKNVKEGIDWSRNHKEYPTGRFSKAIKAERKLFEEYVHWNKR